jgi:hypothetical protein
MSTQDRYEYKRVDCEWNVPDDEREQILADGWEFVARYSVLSDDGRKRERHVFRRPRPVGGGEPAESTPSTPSTPDDARVYGETRACDGAHLEEVVQEALKLSDEKWLGLRQRHKLFYELISGFCGIRFRKPGSF